MIRSRFGAFTPARVVAGDHDLSGRNVVVTGGASGIGYETALALAKAGAHVVAAARTQGGLEELDDAIFAATGRHATLIPFDLVDGGAIDRLGGALYERFGFEREGVMRGYAWRDGEHVDAISMARLRP